MEISQIKYFLNLAETLNFTAAARLSGVSQPSLTKAIQRLEEELGAQLIYRDGKDSRLTPLGKELQVEFQRIMGLLGNVRMLAQNSIVGHQRLITIGVQSTISPGAFSNFFNYVLQQFGSVIVNIEPMQPGENEYEVLSGRYDFCILTTQPMEHVKLEPLILFQEPLMLAMSPNNPLAQKSYVTQTEMSEEPYLDRLHCEFRSQLIDYFMDRNIVMRPRIQSEREDWIQQLVAQGVGVTIVPARSKTVSHVVMKPVEGLDIAREITLVAVSGSGRPKEVSQMIQLAKSFNWNNG